MGDGSQSFGVAADFLQENGFPAETVSGVRSLDAPWILSLITTDQGGEVREHIEMIGSKDDCYRCFKRLVRKYKDFDTEGPDSLRELWGDVFQINAESDPRLQFDQVQFVVHEAWPTVGANDPVKRISKHINADASEKNDS